MKVRVAVLADNLDRFHRIESSIDSGSDCVCVGRFTSAMALRQAVDGNGLDVIVVAQGQTASVAATKRCFPGAHVIAVLDDENPETILDLARAGVDGYLSPHSTPGQFLDAVRTVQMGGASMPPAVAHCLLEVFRDVPGADEYHLSARERNILDALVDGMSYKMVADHFSISIDTVRSHVKHVYGKLHVHSKSEAVAKALRERLL